MAPSEHTGVARGPGAKQWPQSRQKIAIVIWISFLVAALMSLLFFGLIDPVDLLETSAINLGESREQGYAMLFFFFWMGSAASATLAMRLSRTTQARPES